MQAYEFDDMENEVNNDIILYVDVVGNKYPVLNLPGRPKALLDYTVAQIYQVKTKQINQAFSRNKKKFPEDFYFRLTKEELEVVTVCDQLHKVKHRSNLPVAYTLGGINMMSTVLRSEIAVRRSIEIIRAFTLLETTRVIVADDKWDVITAKIIAAVNNNVEKLKYDLVGVKNQVQELTQRLVALEMHSITRKELSRILAVTQKQYLIEKNPK